MKSWRFLAGQFSMFSWTMLNSGIEATSKLAPARNSVLTMAGIGVGLDRVVGLHARQVLAEHGVVAPDLAVIDHEERRAVLLGELPELLL